MQIKYYDFYKNCKDISQTRYEMINHAKKNGYKPTAKIFQTTVKIVKKWVKRFDEGGIDALKDKSKKPNNIPNKILPYWEFKIIDICRDAKRNNIKLNISKTKIQYKIPYSIPTIIKIIDKNKYLSVMNVKKRKNKAFTKLVMVDNEADDIAKLYRDYIKYILR
jgi:hypothetical protein